MKQRLAFAALLLASLSAVGCLQPGAPAPATQTADQGTVTAHALIAIADQDGRRLLAVEGVMPWKTADIDHVNVALYQVGSASPLISQNVSQADLAGTITFTSLRQNTDYKVEVKAWADSAETVRIDNLAADSTSCTTLFSTTNLAVQPVGVLNLRLVNKVFSGTTSGSAIQVTDGLVENPAASEAMTVATPTPVPTATPTPPTYIDSMDPCDPTSTMYNPLMCNGIPG